MQTLALNQSTTNNLEVGKVLNVVVPAGSQALIDLTSSNGSRTRYNPSGNLTIGPFVVEQSYRASCVIGTVTVSEAWKDQAPTGQNVSPATASRAITAADLENIVAVANGITLTMQNDAALGITDASSAPTIAFLPLGAGYTLDVSAVTMIGTAPTIAQNKITGITHVGVNTWAYVG